MSSFEDDCTWSIMSDLYSMDLFPTSGAQDAVPAWGVFCPTPKIVQSTTYCWSPVASTRWLSSPLETRDLATETCRPPAPGTHMYGLHAIPTHPDSNPLEALTASAAIVLGLSISSFPPRERPRRDFRMAPSDKHILANSHNLQAMLQ